MESSDRTATIEEFKADVAFSIGLHSKLDRMLLLFMKRIKSRLGLVDVLTYWQKKQGSWEALSVNQGEITPPKEYAPFVEEVYQDHKDYQILTSPKGSFSYFFLIPNFGVLQLITKFSPLDKATIYGLQPLMIKLAISAILCKRFHRQAEEFNNLLTATEHTTRTTNIVSSISLMTFENFLKCLKEIICYDDTNFSVGAVMLFDFDRFRSVKDYSIFDFNQEILFALKAKLQLILPQNSVIAQVESDILAVLLPNISTNHARATQYVTSLVNAFTAEISNPIVISNRQCLMSFKCGIQTFSAASTNEENKTILSQAIIKQAEFAMDSIHLEQGKSYRFFTKELNAIAVRHRTIDNALQNAIQESELEIFYQPIVNAHEEIIAAEGLLRWNSSELGPISPAEFIPIAEKNGLIIELGYWVLRQVCMRIKENINSKTEKQLKYISANVSGIQFQHHQFGEVVNEILNKYHQSKKHLRIEITESIAVTNLSALEVLIKSLGQDGVQFMLDDFGAGQSSLAYIHKLTLHTIKVDMNFVSGVHKSPKKQILCNAISDICQQMSLECIAEGVEAPADFDYLRSLNIHGFQGFYFFKPLSSDEFHLALKG